MKKLEKAWVDREDGKIKEINFRIKTYKEHCDHNSFVYHDYKLSDILPDNVKFEDLPLLFMVLNSQDTFEIH